MINNVCYSAINKEINLINKIRYEHFELGKDLDTAVLKKYCNSSNNEISNISKFIEAIYEVENYGKLNEKKIWDLIYDNKSIDKLFFRVHDIEKLKDIVLDDFFRICIVNKRYMLFDQISSGLNDDINLLDLTHKAYIYLNTGNYYKYLISQNQLKKIIINSIDSIKYKYSNDEINRIKINLIAIGIKNFDTLNKKEFQNALIKINNIISKPKKIESILFSEELARWGIIDNFKKISKLANIKILKNYYPAFIIKIIYQNSKYSNKIDGVQKFNYIIYKNNYNKIISKFLYLDIDIKWYKEINLENSKSYLIWNEFDIDGKINDENERSIIDIKYIDTLLNNNFILEPNWSKYQILDAVYPTSERQFFYNSINFKKTKNTNYEVSSRLVSMNASVIKEYKKVDFTNLIGNYNIYFQPYFLLDHFINIDTFSESNLLEFKENISTITEVKQYLEFIDDHENVLMNYSWSRIYFLVNLCQKISEFHNLYDEYTRLSKETEMLNDGTNENFPFVLFNAKDKITYLNFLKNENTEKINEFDSMYKNQFFYYANKPIYNTNFGNRFLLNSDLAKNITLNLKERNKLSDSEAYNILGFQEINYLISNRLKEDLNTLNLSNDSTLPINKYTNDYFCIDNKSLNFKLSSDTLYNKFAERFSNRLLDSNSNIIWYFIADDYNGNVDFNHKNLHLFVVFSDKKKFIIIKNLISLDSLNSLINFNNTKYSTFFLPEHLNQIKENSKKIYSILFNEIGKYIDSNEKYKVITPSVLTSIPIDYVFFKNRNFLPYFQECENLLSACFKSDSNDINDNDSISVFSNLTYNNQYCNINNTHNSNIRSGIIELEYSNVEKNEIQKFFNIKNFKDIEASKFNFIKELVNKETKNIHLITHGAYIPEFKDNNIENEKLFGKKNFLNLPILSDERQILLFASDSLISANKNNILTAREIKYLYNLSNINLLYLSACETGLIEDQRENQSGFTGFVKEFLDRGVKFIIATRWKIPDKESANFVSEFYKNLSIHKNYDLSFFKTKLHFLNNRKFEHIWPSFILVR